jgi:hypothetical protein
VRGLHSEKINEEFARRQLKTFMNTETEIDMAKVRDNGTQTPPPNPPKFHLVLTTVVVLICLGAVLWYLVAENSPQIDKSRIIICLACFVLSTVSCLIFAAKVEVTTPVKGFVLSVGGPAVLWMVAYAMFNLMPLNFPIAPTKELKSDLLGYQMWKTKAGISDVFSKNEDDNLSRLVSNIYYPGNEHLKPKDPKLQTAIIYLNTRQAIAFKGIFGKKSDEPRELYCKYEPSIPNSKASQMLYLRTANGIEKVDCDPANPWCRIPFTAVDTFDCLIVTIYDEQDLTDQDFFILEPNRMANTPTNKAALEFAILSKPQLRTELLNFWEVSPYASSENKPPIRFKNLDRAPAILHAENLKELRGWVKDLNEYYSRRKDHWKKGDDEEKKVCDALFSYLSSVNVKLPQLFDETPVFRNRLYVDFGETANPWIATYQWIKK